jgi:hypothetical protein
LLQPPQRQPTPEEKQRSPPSQYQAVLPGPAGIPEDSRGPGEEEQQAEDGQVNEGRLHGGVEEGDDRRQAVEPAVLSGFHISEDHPDGEDRPQGHQALVADVAAVIHHHGGDQKEEGGGEAAPAAQPAAHEEGQHHQDDPGQGHGKASGEIVRPEQKISEGVEMELEGTVHKGSMLKTFAFKELIGVVDVEAFVVAHHPLPQAPEAGEDGGGQQHRPGEALRRCQILPEGLPSGSCRNPDRCLHRSAPAKMPEADYSTRKGFSRRALYGLPLENRPL